MIRHVTAAVIERNNKILIARRKKDSHLGLKWEFPGGTIEKDETAEECLERELHEEFGIRVIVQGFVWGECKKQKTNSRVGTEMGVDY